MIDLKGLITNTEIIDPASGEILACISTGAGVCHLRTRTEPTQGFHTETNDIEKLEETWESAVKNARKYIAARDAFLIG